MASLRYGQYYLRYLTGTAHIPGSHVLLSCINRDLSSRTLRYCKPCPIFDLHANTRTLSLHVLYYMLPGEIVVAVGPSDYTYGGIEKRFFG